MSDSNEDTTLFDYIRREFDCIDLPFPQAGFKFKVEGFTHPEFPDGFPVDEFEKAFLEFSQPPSCEIILQSLVRFHEGLGYRIVNEVADENGFTLHVNIETNYTIVSGFRFEAANKLVIISTM